MKTIKMLGIAVVLVMMGLNTEAFAGYSELTPDEKTVITQAATLAGWADSVETYYLMRRSEEIAVAKEAIRQGRLNAIIKKINTATDAQLEQVEAIFP